MSDLNSGRTVTQDVGFFRFSEKKLVSDQQSEGSQRGPCSQVLVRSGAVRVAVRNLVVISERFPFRMIQRLCGISDDKF